MRVLAMSSIKMLAKRISTIIALILWLPIMVLAAPQPAVIDPADQKPFIGATFSIEVAFDNINASDTGYGPFLDVVLPVNGIDGVVGAGVDGVDIAAANATYLGEDVGTITQVFPDDDDAGAGTTGCLEHPFAVDSVGDPLQVCGTAGDKLVTIMLPFGSFVPNQPPAFVALDLRLSNKADLDVPLTLYSRAGFRFGATALNDFSTDPSILSAVGTNLATWDATTITPQLITLTKSYSGPEDETATGPNFPRRYTITVDVAQEQVITDFDLTDFLPDNMAFLRLISSSSSSGAGTATATPTVGVAANSPDNDLVVNFASVTGGTPVTVTFEYFIPRLDANGAVIINAASGDDVISENQAQAIGDWDPIDTRDPGATDNAVANPDGVEHRLTDKSIAIQKSVAIVTDTGNIGEENPGDTLEYTLTFQVSDYFSFDDVVVTDIISDGQRFDASFTPTLSTAIHGVSTSSADMSVFDGTSGADVIPNFSAPPGDGNYEDGTDGTTKILFRVSDELFVRTSGNSKMPGGCVPDAGTGEGNLPDCSASDQGATTATITFRTIIQQEFSDHLPSGDASVDQGDVLTNAVTIAGQLLSVEDNSTTADMGTEADTSSASVSIAYGALAKSIYKINGTEDPVGDPIQVQPGDTVTYRLRYTMPTSDVEDLVFTDYLPKPVFDATEVVIFENTNIGVPAAGRAQFGPDDSFGELYNGVPAIATVGLENSLSFTYGDYDNSDQRPREIDILFTVTVNNEPFADGLFLTNQVRVTQDSTNADATQADAIVQIQLQEPVLAITKGVSDSSNTASKETIAPAADILPVDGDISEADAGDVVTFVITVENQGHAPAYDVLVTEDVPAGLTGCSVVSVVNGDEPGTALAFSGELFGAGLTLSNPLAANDGTIGEPYGTDTALITVTCTLAADVNPGDVFENTATVVWKAESGESITPFVEKSDSATVTVAQPGIVKDVETVTPGPNSPHVTAGDEVTYLFTVTLPEGVTPGLVLTDLLPVGFSYLDGTVFVDHTGFGGSLDTSPTVTVLGSPSSGTTVTITFDSPTNTTVTGDGNPNNNSFLVSLAALVLDDADNNDGLPLQSKTNRVTLSYTDMSGAPISDTATINFSEPDLQVSKTMTPATVDAGDTITVTLKVENVGLYFTGI